MQTPEGVGQNLPYEEIDSLSDEQREKLFKMHDETARLFSGNYNAGDMGVGIEEVQEGTVVEDSVEMKEAKKAMSGIPTVTVQSK